MRKPIDPRYHGLTEPKKLLTYTGQIFVADLEKTLGKVGRIHLQDVVDAWNKIVSESQALGHRVIEEPYFEEGAYYGRSASLTYTLGYDNETYTMEMAEYIAKVTKYERDLVAYQEWEEREKIRTPDLTEKIERTKRRLANLEAARDGLPVPYPTT